MTDYKIMPYFVLHPLSLPPKAEYIIWSFLCSFYYVRSMYTV